MNKKMLLSREELIASLIDRSNEKEANSQTDNNMNLYSEYLTQRVRLEESRSLYLEEPREFKEEKEEPSKQYTIQKEIVGKNKKFTKRSSQCSLPEEKKNSKNFPKIGFGIRQYRDSSRNQAPASRSHSSVKNLHFSKKEKGNDQKRSVSKGIKEKGQSSTKLSNTSKTVFQNATVVNDAKEYSSTKPTQIPPEEDKKLENTDKKALGNFRPSEALLHKCKEDTLPQFDKLSLLPPPIFIKIVDFLINKFRLLLRINPSWYYATTNTFDNLFNSIENSFVSVNSDFLLFKDSYTSSTVTKFCGKEGVRIDRVLKCENLIADSGKTLVFGYTYKYCNEKANKYQADFTFDSVARTANCIWLHKNECAVNHCIRLCIVS